MASSPVAPSQTSLPDLTLKALPASSLPTGSNDSVETFLQSYLDAAQSLLASFDSSEGWKKGGSHVDGTVESFTRPKQEHPHVPVKGKHQANVVGRGDFWCARRSVHKESYEDFSAGLLSNHAINESEYIPALTNSLLVQPLTLHPPATPPRPSTASTPFLANVYRLHYTLPSPLSARTFVVLLVQIETKEGEEFINIQVPVESNEVRDNEGDEKGRVRGSYCSVERVRKLTGPEGQHGGVEWTMMTASTPGGSVPQFIVHKSLPGEIAKDVPYFLNWLHKRKEGIKQVRAYD